MGRPRTNDEVVRQRLVSVAVELVHELGVARLTIRDVARRADTSTTAIYSLFDDRCGLIAAVRERAVAGLRDALHGPRAGDDPLADIEALGLAYWAWARDNPHLYAVLFGGLQKFEPGPGAAADDPVAPLMSAIGRAVEQGLLSGSPTTMAVSLWAGLHGTVMLALDGALDAEVARSIGRTATAAMLRGWEPGAIVRAAH